MGAKSYIVMKVEQKNSRTCSKKVGQGGRVDKNTWDPL